MTYKEFMDILDLYALECPVDAEFWRNCAARFVKYAHQHWSVVIEPDSNLLAYLPPGCISPVEPVGSSKLLLVRWT